MFEIRDVDRCRDSVGGAAGVLGASNLAGWIDSLSTALGAVSGLDDVGRVNAIRKLDELVCVATAAQAALTAELDASQRAANAESGIRPEVQGRGIGLQVALARRESHHRGKRHLSLARIVAIELPHTWEAWRTGQISEYQATLIARETVFLSRGDRLTVDAQVAGRRNIEQVGTRELVQACQKAACELDPESFVARRRQAEADRHVSLRPAPDAMTWLTALLPVADGVAAYAALTIAADSATAAGDPRSRGQVMADTLVCRVAARDTDRDTSAPAKPSEITWASASASPPAPVAQSAGLSAPNRSGPNRSGPGRGVPIRLHLVMSDQALFGTSDQAAHLDGYGPIPAELARELVKNAIDAEEKVWVQRLYTQPATGELVGMDAKPRLFPARLARFIRLRDQTCRTPWCDAPIRHLDHAKEHVSGGATSAVNGQGLCVACNHAKQAPGWRAGPAPGPIKGAIETTTPTGHTHTTRPPIIGTITRRTQRMDVSFGGPRLQLVS